MWLAGAAWVFGQPLEEVLRKRVQRTEPTEVRREGVDFHTQAEVPTVAPRDSGPSCPAHRLRLVRKLLREIDWFLWCQQWPGGQNYDAFGWPRVWLWEQWFRGRDWAERKVQEKQRDQHERTEAQLQTTRARR